MPVAGPSFDVQMREISLQSFRESLGLISTDRSRAKRMTSDVRPAQTIMINEDYPADAGLRQRPCDRRPDRPAAEQVRSRRC